VCRLAVPRFLQEQVFALGFFFFFFFFLCKLQAGCLLRCWGQLFFGQQKERLVRGKHKWEIKAVRRGQGPRGRGAEFRSSF
jgi:hypothetical protein